MTKEEPNWFDSRPPESNRARIELDKRLQYVVDNWDKSADPLEQARVMGRDYLTAAMFRDGIMPGQWPKVYGTQLVCILNKEGYRPTIGRLEEMVAASFTLRFRKFLSRSEVLRWLELQELGQDHEIF